MKTKLTLLLMAVAAACLIAVRAFTPAVDDAPVAPATSNAGYEIEAAPEAAPDPVEPQGPATEIVMGLEVLKDRNCTVERHYVDLGNGTVTEAYRCVPVSPQPDDYELYSDEQLRVLAYSDAKAASVLGKRLVESNPAEAEAWLLRAVALRPADLDPVMWLAAQAHSLRGSSAAAQDARADTYVLTRTAQALGSTAAIGWILDDLRQAGFTLDDVAQLDERVRANLRRIREIQLEVVGESTIAEGEVQL